MANARVACDFALRRTCDFVLYRDISSGQSAALVAFQVLIAGGEMVSRLDPFLSPTHVFGVRTLLGISVFFFAVQ